MINISTSEWFLRGTEFSITSDPNGPDIIYEKFKYLEGVNFDIQNLFYNNAKVLAIFEFERFSTEQNNIVYNSIDNQFYHNL